MPIERLEKKLRNYYITIIVVLVLVNVVSISISASQFNKLTEETVGYSNQVNALKNKLIVEQARNDICGENIIQILKIIKSYTLPLDDVYSFNSSPEILTEQIRSIKHKVDMLSDNVGQLQEVKENNKSSMEEN